MEIRILDVTDGKIIVPVGDIDMASSGVLNENLQKFARQKMKKILISLEEVNYIDSSGLTALIQCMQEMQKYGGSLRLIINKPKIMDVFKLARLDRIFHIHSTRESAEKS